MSVAIRVESRALLLRVRDTGRLLGIGRSEVYRRCADGRLPRPVQLGLQTSVWPSYEVEAIARAMIAGWDADRLRALVEGLTALRPELLAATELALSIESLLAEVGHAPKSDKPRRDRSRT